MGLRIEFKLTVAEFNAAMRAYSGPTLRRGVIRLWVLTGLILLTGLALVALSIDQPSALLEPALMMLCAWVVALPVAWVMGPRLAAREIAPAFLESTELSCDMESFSVTRETFWGSGSWAHFRSWRELHESFVLAHSANVLLLVPKRVLSSEDELALRELLGRVIGRPDEEASRSVVSPGAEGERS